MASLESSTAVLFVVHLIHLPSLDATAYLMMAAALPIGGLIVKGLQESWGKKAVESTNARLGELMAQRGRHYRSYLRGGKWVDLNGLHIVEGEPIALEDVFVDVSLGEEALHRMPQDILSQGLRDGSHRYSIWDFLNKREPQILALIGAPGSGKTTLVRNVQLRMAKSRGRGRRTPILITLRKVAPHISNAPGTPLAQALVASTDVPIEHLEGWLESQLRESRCTVLLDGLDEIADAGTRQSTADWIGRQIQRYPGNHFVITTRPHGYRSALVSGALILNVRPFTTPQITDFVQRWYQAAHRARLGLADSPGPVAGATDLLNRLARVPDLQALASNPLLLTMIVNVHRSQGTLPKRRVDLYKEICDAMLWRREIAKALSVVPDGPERKTLLCRVAYQMMRDQTASMTEQQLATLIAREWRALVPDVKPSAFGYGMTTAGLLREEEPGIYRFAHRTLQEYLAAEHVGEQQLDGALLDVIDQPWWRETILLRAARCRADHFVRACLSKNSSYSLALAFACADSALSLSEVLLEELDRILDEAWDPGTDADRRACLARVLIGRSFNDVILTAQGTEVCLHPVSERLFSLYRAWQGGPHPEGLPSLTGERPQVGLWSSQAKALLTWINLFVDTVEARTYAFPTAAELNDPRIIAGIVHETATPASLVVWTYTGDDQKVYAWVPPGVSHPHRVDRVAVERSVAHHLAATPLFLARILLMRISTISTAGRYVVTRSSTPRLSSELALARKFMNELHLDLSAVVALTAGENHGPSGLALNSLAEAAASAALECIRAYDGARPAATQWDAAAEEAKRQEWNLHEIRSKYNAHVLRDPRLIHDPTLGQPYMIEGVSGLHDAERSLTHVRRIRDNSRMRFDQAMKVAPMARLEAALAGIREATTQFNDQESTFLSLDKAHTATGTAGGVGPLLAFMQELHQQAENITQGRIRLAARALAARLLDDAGMRQRYEVMIDLAAYTDAGTATHNTPEAVTWIQKISHNAEATFPTLMHPEASPEAGAVARVRLAILMSGASLRQAEGIHAFSTIELAAALTLLERRLSGEEPPSEVVVLIRR